MRSFRKTALALSVALALTGCSDGDAPDGTTPTPTTGGRATPEPVAYAKEGWTGPVGPVRVRLEVGAVEKHADQTILRFYVTNLGERPAFPDLSTSIAQRSDVSMTLLDPVGGRAYLPLRDAGNRQIGSDTRRQPQYQPGVRYEHVLAFPRLPADLTTLTVLTNTTAGEFTGIPVTEGAGAPGPSAPPVPAAPKDLVAGQTYGFPLREDVGPAEGGSEVELTGLTETDVKSTSSSADGEEVGLRTDVLFALDSAKLSPRARAVLDDVAAEIEARADVQLSITGHTDDTGTPAHNLDLSERRADAVLKELKARLGDGWKYLARGAGESEPAVEPGGQDVEEARARNRRVEIAYDLRPQEPPPSVNAAFRDVDGPVVASEEAEFAALSSTTRRRIDVKPFYRDGAYLVAVFDITNLGPGTLSETLPHYRGVNGGQFGAFTVIDPASGIRYASVRLGPVSPTGRAPYADPGGTIFQTTPDTTNRGFFYVPTPPASVTSVTFDAGPFGTFPDIPIR
ncbi:OmpA family protein [Actinocorallia sp. A-T 12471]|uniref:OmpA family protein n=1 Tax=Actinocorallia sp. A-T 12471 TaxID=3089813 RepID=UPI0029CFF3B6|nr:OmpA family protein [Actinocorallia sp. A-T 12471]MDX6739351.1 OmpA family protein [Actinocorallia sp. A-T 12471]